MRCGHWPITKVTHGHPVSPKSALKIVALWRAVADRVQHPALHVRGSTICCSNGATEQAASGRSRRSPATWKPRDHVRRPISTSLSSLSVPGTSLRGYAIGASWPTPPPNWSSMPRRSCRAASLELASSSRCLRLSPPGPLPRQRVQAPQSIPDPAIVGRLLETSFAIAKGGFQTSLIAAMMRVRATDPAEIDQINRREVAAYRAQAAKHTGMARQARLEDAIRIARDRGLTNLVRQLTSELQAIPVKDLGLKELSWSVRLPPHQVELFLDGFVAGANWREGLHFFLQTDCPTGDLDRLRQELRDNAAHTAFLNVVGRTIVGKGGLPRYTGTSDDDRRAAAEADHARIRADIQGQILAEGLLRMPGRYGIPDESQIAAFLSNDGKSDEALALSLARGFRHYWHGDYEACAHVVTPKIEAAARALLRNLDEGIYRVQVAKDPGQYPGLHVLLQELESLAWKSRGRSFCAGCSSARTG